MEKLLEAGLLAGAAARAVRINRTGGGGVGPPGEEGLIQASPSQGRPLLGSPGVGCVWTQFSSPSSPQSQGQGQGSSSVSGWLEEEERELDEELLLDEELELLEELDEEEEELLDEEELELLDDELDDELELLEEELELEEGGGALLEVGCGWATEEL